MQSGIDPTTTVRHYGLFAMAHQALIDAETVRHAAYIAADADPTRVNIQAFMDADAAFKTAEKNFNQVRGFKKYMKGTRQ